MTLTLGEKIMKSYIKPILFTSLLAVGIGCGGPLDEIGNNDDANSWDEVSSTQTDALRVAAEPAPGRRHL